jgi:hypothetical protein
MSMRFELPDEGLVASVLEVARASWEPADLTALWERLGWKWSRTYDGYPITRRFVLQPADPDRADGRPGGAFFVDFCVFLPPDDDPDGDEIAEDWDGPKWPLRREAGRDEFDAACAEVTALVTKLLGEPLLAGRDSDEEAPWMYALWRLEGVNRLVAVAQRDDIGMELGSLWIREAPATDPLPSPAEPFVDWLYRDTD